MFPSGASGSRVAIFGGGVAGLTAAHELIERGFAVTVFERRSVVGGKARSVGVPGSGQGGRRDLPGEHGFRFFPGFYRHVADTMQRIPYGRNRRGVLDNLVDTTRIGVTRPDTRTMVNAVHFPRSVQDLRTIARVFADNDFALSRGDMWRGLGGILRVATMCDERRDAELDPISWADFARADQGSPGYQTLIGTPHLFVALRGEEISARTTGKIAIQMLQTLLVPGGSSDRVLCGPTSDVWLEPWADHLRRLGVQFRLEAALTALHTDGRRLTGATIREGGEESEVSADWFVAALPVEEISPLISPALSRIDASLARLPRLAEQTRWMVGMQIFLRSVPALLHGHYLHLDSPWALTSVMHQQFWPKEYLRHFGDGQTAAVLSVDISEWDTPGRCGKPARACTAEELRAEIWQQLCEAINVGGRRILQSQDVQEVFFCPSLVPAGAGRLASYHEPLFVNTAGTGSLRPTAATAVENLMLAGDYVRTSVELACMEGANEAARRAVNEVLRRSGARSAPCPLWPLAEPWIFRGLRSLDALAFRTGRTLVGRPRRTELSPRPQGELAPSGHREACAI